MLRERIRAAAVRNVEVTQGDGQRVPLPDGTFDLVFLVDVVGEVPDKVAFFDECARVLKLGGTLAVTSHRGWVTRMSKSNIPRADYDRERRTKAMGKIRTGHSVSLDGFIAGPNDGPEAPIGEGGERLLAWYSSGDTEYRLPGTEMVFRVSPQTAEFLRETRETTGALVTGRRTFDLTNGWGGGHPMGVPVFVLTHTVPQEWVYEGSPFAFVTDGLESAVERARAVAGDKDVGVIGASLVQQCIRKGLLEEIHLDLVPVLLGGGVRLFDHLGTEPIELESIRVVHGVGVTHLTFRVAK